VEICPNRRHATGDRTCDERVDVLGVSGLLTARPQRSAIKYTDSARPAADIGPLHATLAWSYDVLVPDEQLVRVAWRLHRRFRFESGQSVSPSMGFPREVIDHIATWHEVAVVATSTIQARSTVAGYHPRLCVGETDRGGEADQVSRQHVAWVLEAVSSIETEIGTATANDLAQRP